MRRAVEFPSNGVTCRGWFYTPDQGTGPFPAIVLAGGWCYVKEIVMPQYAESFVQEGLAVLLFDYRYFGESDGQPRQHLDPWDQIEDYKNAISFVSTLPEVDPNRIGIWGVSYSGGHVLIVGASDPRVKCIVSNIPVVDGYMNVLRMHGEDGFAVLRSHLIGERQKRFEQPGHIGHLPMSRARGDHETLATFPDPRIYEVFIKLKETTAPRHEHYSTTVSTELLLSYSVLPHARRILDAPTLMVIAENDNITPWDLQIDVFNQIPSRRKTLVVLPDVSHMSLYSKRSHLEIAAAKTAPWLREQL